MIKRININDTFDVDAFEAHCLNLNQGTLWILRQVCQRK